MVEGNSNGEKSYTMYQHLSHTFMVLGSLVRNWALPEQRFLLSWYNFLYFDTHSHVHSCILKLKNKNKKNLKKEKKRKERKILTCMHKQGEAGNRDLVAQINNTNY